VVSNEQKTNNTPYLILVEIDRNYTELCSITNPVKIFRIMRSSDQEIIDFLNQLIKLGRQIIDESEKEQKKALIDEYLIKLKEIIEWPHLKQINPLITMRIKNFETAPFVAYLKDLPLTKHSFGIFKSNVSNADKFINQQVSKIELGLEAIRYFYKNK
jgi:hypothetical protein